MQSITRTTCWQIDADDTIRHVDKGFVAFAMANHGAHLVGSVTGKPIWGFLAGSETREIYQTIIQGVRSRNRAANVPYRCDSPDCRRFLEMTILPVAAGGLAFVSRTVREERRHPVPLLDPTLRRTDELLRMCAWCKQVDTPEGWLDVEYAVARLGYFHNDVLPGITHGICPACCEQTRKLARDVSSA
jgi:hypothetical protein